MAATPGWYPDASQRFHLRYHDGLRWTEHIVDEHDRRGTDPVGAGPPTPVAPPPRHVITPSPWRRELPLVVAGLGALLVALSAFTLSFLGEGGSGASLHQLGRLDRLFTGWPLDAYAGLGRFATLPVIGLAVLAATRWVGDEPRLMRVAAILAGLLGLWHIVAMFATGEIEASPTVGAFVGVLGYAGVVAGPLLRHHDVTR